MCFLLTPQRRKKGEQVIREAMERTTDPTIKNLGEVSLEWAEKDLSKKERSKAPFFAEKQAVESEGKGAT